MKCHIFYKSRGVTCGSNVQPSPDGMNIGSCGTKVSSKPAIPTTANAGAVLASWSTLYGLVLDLAGRSFKGDFWERHEKLAVRGHAAFNQLMTLWETGMLDSVHLAHISRSLKISLLHLPRIAHVPSPTTLNRQVTNRIWRGMCLQCHWGKITPENNPTLATVQKTTIICRYLDACVYAYIYIYIMQ